MTSRKAKKLIEKASWVWQQTLQIEDEHVCFDPHVWRTQLTLGSISVDGSGNTKGMAREKARIRMGLELERWGHLL